MSPIVKVSLFRFTSIPVWGTLRWFWLFTMSQAPCISQDISDSAKWLTKTKLFLSFHIHPHGWVAVLFLEFLLMVLSQARTLMWLQQREKDHGNTCWLLELLLWSHTRTSVPSHWTKNVLWPWLSPREGGYTTFLQGGAFNMRKQTSFGPYYFWISRKIILEFIINIPIVETTSLKEVMVTVLIFIVKTLGKHGTELFCICLYSFLEIREWKLKP